MTRLYFYTCSVLAFASFACVAAEFRFPNQTFTVPDGFEVEQIAGPPLIERPISASFDESGNLYVTDSSGSNDKVEKQLAEKPHRVMRLDDVDERGRFRHSALFADRMMFPEGCLWHDGSLYVSAPPSIWKLTDSNGDGLADQRLEWHEGKTLTGCANDLHGPYLGLDGWLYWCKGAFARQTYERTGHVRIDTRASHIFRAPADHSDLEPVLTAGMDNPVGVVFTLGGERFMCGTFLMHPEAGKRDGVVHAVYGGVYGKPNDVLEEHAKTGELMPIMTHLGAAAPCSVIRYESDAFGPEYGNNLFVCCFNLHKITRHVLQPDGAGFKTVDSDFLVSDNTDFHPTDVLEDADGSLLVVDTGGWYKLCCPTSQLSKPDVLGVIYRIRRSGSTRVADPRGLTLRWDKLDAAGLAELLCDSRPAVRKRALLQLSKLGPSTVQPLVSVYKGTNSPETRAILVWALTRIDGLEARNALRICLRDPAEVVKQAAAHSVALWRDSKAEPELLKLLQSSNLQTRRVAAEALGRIGAKSSVPQLLAVAADAAPRDRVLEHSALYATIEIADPVATAYGLKSADVSIKRASLIALDQMHNGDLQADTVIPLLEDPDVRLRQTAFWVAGHHAAWAGRLGQYFEKHLHEQNATPENGTELKYQLSQFAHTKPIQELVAAELQQSNTPAAARRLLLEIISEANLKDPPPGWVQAIQVSLEQTDSEVLRAAVHAARKLTETKARVSDISTPLMRVAKNGSAAADLRLEALQALPSGNAVLDSDLLALARTNLDPAVPVLTRQSAANVIARSKLESQQLLELAESVRTTGPLELPQVLQAFEQSTNEAIGLAVMNALQNCRSIGSLRPELIQKLVTHYPSSVQDRGTELLKSMQVDTATQAARLDELLASLGKGDIRRGQALFNSQKAACSSCHAMGYLGGHVGPDLTSIGQVRTERDLLESIAFPNASFVRSFEPYIVRTKSDEDYSGVLRKDAPDEVILATGPSTEVRISRSDIVELRPGTVSVMPAGLDQQLTKQELSDLVAFLKATKWGAQ